MLRTRNAASGSIIRLKIHIAIPAKRRDGDYFHRDIKTLQKLVFIHASIITAAPFMSRTALMPLPNGVKVPPELCAIWFL